MTKQVINVGTTANDGTGDQLRTAFTKTNANFTETYDSIDSLNTSVGSLNIIVTDLTSSVDGIVTFSGNYNDLTNKPTIPQDVSDLTDNTSLLGNPFDQTLNRLDDVSFNHIFAAGHITAQQEILTLERVKAAGSLELDHAKVTDTYIEFQGTSQISLEHRSERAHLTIDLIDYKNVTIQPVSVTTTEIVVPTADYIAGDLTGSVSVYDVYTDQLVSISSGVDDGVNITFTISGFSGQYDENIGIQFVEEYTASSTGVRTISIDRGGEVDGLTALNGISSILGPNGQDQFLYIVSSTGNGSVTNATFTNSSILGVYNHFFGLTELTDAKVSSDLTVNGVAYFDTNIVATSGLASFSQVEISSSLSFGDSTTQSSAAISIADLKILVAASVDFADFKTRIAAL